MIGAVITIANTASTDTIDAGIIATIATNPDTGTTIESIEAIGMTAVTGGIDTTGKT